MRMKERIGSVEEVGTTDSVYSSMRTRSPSFEGVKKRVMLREREGSVVLKRFHQRAVDVFCFGRVVGSRDETGSFFFNK